MPDPEGARVVRAAGGVLWREVEGRVAEVYEAGRRAGAYTEDILDDVFSVMESRGL